MYSKPLQGLGGLGRDRVAGMYESELVEDPGLYEGLGSRYSFGLGP